MNKDFSISEAINFGWETFKSNWKFWVVVTLLVGVGKFGAGATSFGNTADNFNPEKFTREISQNAIVENSGIAMLQDFNGAVLGTHTQQAPGGPDTALIVAVGIIAAVGALFAFVLIILSALANIIFRMGHINLLLDAARGNELYYKTLLNQVSFKKAFRFLAAISLAAIITFFGYLFFIIPGIIFTFMFIFVPYVVVDEDPGIRKALKRSSELTKGVRFKLFLFGLTMVGLSIVGLLALGIGLYIVSIVGALAFAYIYVKVHQQEVSSQTQL